MRHSGEDAHELTTLCSLRTASSDTLQIDAALNDGSAKDDSSLRTGSAAKQPSPCDNQHLAASRLAGGEPKLREDAFDVVFELSRAKHYGPEMMKAAMNLLQRELGLGMDQSALARALVSLPVEEIQEFLNRWIDEENTRWFDRFPVPAGPRRPRKESAFHITLRTRAQKPNEFWCALITAMAEAHATLDRPRALALLAPFNLAPLALLFPEAPDTSPADLALAYVRKTYDDRLPQARAADAHPPEADRALEVFAAYFAARPDPEPLDALLDRLVAGIDTRAPEASFASDREALLAAMPGLAGVCATPLLSAHPAAPYLLFALRLAAWSPATRRGLVARGVVGAVERLYDADEGDVVSTISQHIVLSFCYALLGALGDCYDAARSTLMDELREEIVSYSRSMSRRFFAPEVWEIRDD